MQIKPYSKYRETSIKWAPIIPSDWDDTSVKFCFDIQLGKMLQPKQENIDDVEYPYLKALHVNWDNIDTETLPKMFVSENDIKKYSVVEGDLLVCEGGEVGRAAILKKLHEPAIIQNALHRVRNDELGDVSYFSYMLRNVADAGWFDILCNKATIAHLTGEKLGAIRFPVPPIEEQQKIAAFLDYKTQQIDQLIAKKKALIEKLEEKRIAVITQAVTKGLDKKVRLKPSGVAWLGDVPEHWDVIPVKFSLEIPITDGPHETPELFNEGIPFLSAEAVKNDKLDFVRKRGFISIEEHQRFSRKYKPKYGDVYMVKSGATTGNVARVETEEEFNIWSPLAALRPDVNRIITDFLFFFMKSKPFLQSVELSWSFGTQQNIGMGVISNLKITLPPVEEQNQIATHIIQECEYIDKMKLKVVDAIARLEEYRSAIITSAVTGRIDVRNVDIPKEIA